MGKNVNISIGGGTGFFVSVLTLIFITLKLTKVIDWNWWWILSPLWISALVGLSILFIALIIILLFSRKIVKRRR